MAGYSWSCNRQNSNNKYYKCAMHIVIGRLSCTFLHWRMVLFSVYCKSYCVVLCVNK